MTRLGDLDCSIFKRARASFACQNLPLHGPESAAVSTRLRSDPVQQERQPPQTEHSSVPATARKATETGTFRLLELFTSAGLWRLRDLPKRVSLDRTRRARGCEYGKHKAFLKNSTADWNKSGANLGVRACKDQAPGSEERFCLPTCGVIVFLHCERLLPGVIGAGETRRARQSAVVTPRLGRAAPPPRATSGQ